MSTIKTYTLTGSTNDVAPVNLFFHYALNMFGMLGEDSRCSAFECVYVGYGSRPWWLWRVPGPFVCGLFAMFFLKLTNNFFSLLNYSFFLKSFFFFLPF